MLVWGFWRFVFSFVRKFWWIDSGLAKVALLEILRNIEQYRFFVYSIQYLNSPSTLDFKPYCSTKELYIARRNQFLSTFGAIIKQFSEVSFVTSDFGPHHVIRLRACSFETRSYLCSTSWYGIRSDTWSLWSIPVSLDREIVFQESRCVSSLKDPWVREYSEYQVQCTRNACHVVPSCREVAALLYSYIVLENYGRKSTREVILHMLLQWCA